MKHNTSSLLLRSTLRICFLLVDARISGESVVIGYPVRMGNFLFRAKALYPGFEAEAVSCSETDWSQLGKDPGHITWMLSTGCAVSEQPHCWRWEVSVKRTSFASAGSNHLARLHHFLVVFEEQNGPQAGDS